MDLFDFGHVDTFSVIMRFNCGAINVYLKLYFLIQYSNISRLHISVQYMLISSSTVSLRAIMENVDI